MVLIWSLVCSLQLHVEGLHAGVIIYFSTHAGKSTIYGHNMVYFLLVQDTSCSLCISLKGMDDLCA